ncbi:MAG: NAD(P)H-dependent oxidoreductase [Candidatus Colwellbacteria bacterium]|nr:NAD(P)H-dependent oxidoreductase [Candidatus Colwellbacteria bacterium]
MKVLAISGSLRTESYNRKALQVAKKIATDLDAEVRELDLRELNLPLYDKDIQDRGMPEPVQILKKEIEARDVLIIASPEYNYSVSGALKNMIDWASRGEKNSFNGKVAVIFGASTGGFGSLRGQTHLRQILQALNVFILPQPQVFISRAETAFNPYGSFANPKNFESLKSLIEKSLAFASKIKS